MTKPTLKQLADAIAEFDGNGLHQAMHYRQCMGTDVYKVGEISSGEASQP